MEICITIGNLKKNSQYNKNFEAIIKHEKSIFIPKNFDGIVPTYES